MTRKTEAFLCAGVWTYTVNNRCHGICNLVGSAGVAHGFRSGVAAGEDLEKLVWISVALALLFLTGTQTAFGQHNLETETDPGVSSRGDGDLFTRGKQE